MYEAMPSVPIEDSTTLDRDPACTRCSLHEGLRTPCLPADGEPGGLLVIGDTPGKKHEDRRGRPFVGEAGELVRQIISKHWGGAPVVYDYAVRCAPGDREVKDKHADTCRPFLAATIAEARPTRIVALGGWAAYSLTGRAVTPFSMRRSYTYLLGERFGEDPLPVFFVLNPGGALGNRIIKQWLREDLTWALTAEPPPLPPVDVDVRVVRDEVDAAAAVAELSAHPWISFDVETAGILYTDSFRLLCVTFAAPAPPGQERPITWDGAALAHPGARALLIRLLTDPRVQKRGANVKYDDVACELTLGVRPRNVEGDVRLWRKLLEPESDGHLDKMAELVGMGGMKEEQEGAMAVYVKRVQRALQLEARAAKNAREDAERAGRGEKKRNRAALRVDDVAALDYWARLQREDPKLAEVIKLDPSEWKRWAYALVPSDLLVRYNARDTVATSRLIEQVEPQLAAVPPVDRIRKLIVDPASRAIRQVEAWGVSANRDAVLAFDAYCGIKLSMVEEKFTAYGTAYAKGAGLPVFNPDSTKQVADLLFGTGPGRLGLRAVVTTDSGQPSTNEAALAHLKDHPFVQALLDHRSYTKLKGTYAEGMLGYLRPAGRGWRIHPSILLDGARSGRTSCSNPNLQNIPRADSLEGKMARDCFIAPPGFTLVQLDYSQLELRIAAMLSGDPVMRQIFLDGVDYHQRTAELVAPIVWKLTPDQVEKKHRSIAKTFNFGLLYGMGDAVLAERMGTTVKMAAKVREAIMGQLKVLDRWIQARVLETQKTGFAWTWWDGQPARRRPMWQIADSDSYRASVAEHGAYNTPVQGTASEFCIASLVECVNWILDDGIEDVVRLTLPVHDSLLFEVRDDMVDEVAHTARAIMLGFNSAGVPLEVDCETGKAWGSLTKYDFNKAA
jgi:uracil-DNA glycosylase family 4